jgi:gamma-glutamylaminecyclotransferase
MKIFVYGTLKTGHCRSHLLADQKFVCDAETEDGYAIFNCGGFPGLVESETGIVEGEIWQVDEQYVDYLDKIEGSPFLYKLEPVKINGFENIPAYAYFWQKSTEKLKKCGPIWKKEFGEK